MRQICKIVIKGLGGLTQVGLRCKVIDNLASIEKPINLDFVYIKKADRQSRSTRVHFSHNCSNSGQSTSILQVFYCSFIHSFAIFDVITWVEKQTSLLYFFHIDTGQVK